VELLVLESHLEGIQSIVSSLDTSGLDGTVSSRLVELFSKGERLCGAGKALAAARVAETGIFELEGARDASEWLAAVTGDSRFAADQILETARNLEKLPPSLDEAFRSGELSGKQANEIRRAASVDPERTDELVELAPSTSLRGLREKADKVIGSFLSKEEDEERNARVHRERHLYTRMQNGAFTGEFFLTPEQGAHLMGAVNSLAEEFFEAARLAGEAEPYAAYVADGLVALARGETQGPGPSPRGGGPDYQVVMRIDLEALSRGSLLPGEECSIEHLGHVPVSVVQRYLDRAKVRLVVTEGTDVSSVYSCRRNIKKALDVALLERDRGCVVPGCRATRFLERDHLKEFARGGPTCLSNLVLLCSRHHGLKTNHGFRIVGSPGNWRWLRPDGRPAGPYEKPGPEEKSKKDDARGALAPSAVSTKAVDDEQLALLE
jgi:hypothetical protein